MSRLDIYLTDNGLQKSRERAKKLIKNGCVKVNGKICTKPAFEVDDNVNIEINDSDPELVGRGGLKLAGAFKVFDVDVKNKVCVDIGASTGGFTQCLLRNGAEKVYAVDVGHDQLAVELINDSRVINCEGVNAKNLNKDFFDDIPDFASADLSFISLAQVIRPIYDCISDKGECIVLIKPQFEAGKKALNKKGIVKDKADHINVILNLCECFEQAGFGVCGISASDIKGGDGNIEYLVYLKKNSRDDFLKNFDCRKFVNTAFSNFNKEH